jgi:hypothetical protein
VAGDQLRVAIGQLVQAVLAGQPEQRRWRELLGANSTPENLRPGIAKILGLTRIEVRRANEAAPGMASTAVVAQKLLGGAFPNWSPRLESMPCEASGATYAALWYWLPQSVW